MTLRSSKDFEVEKEPGLQRHADNLLISLSILVFKMDLHLEVLDVPLYPFVDLLGLAGAECMNRNLELFFFLGFPNESVIWVERQSNKTHCEAIRKLCNW